MTATVAALSFSYSSRDRRLAQQLVAELTKLGHRIAIDTDSLVPGVEWRRELLDKLLLSDGVVVLLTPNAVVTIRYYEKIGLMPAALRTDGNYRMYGLEHRRRLHFIRRCRGLGFTLDQVRDLLRLS